MQRTPALMRRALMRSLLLAVGVTLATALVGLAYGWAQTQNIDIADYRGWFIPPGIGSLRNYLCVGYMHNAAYLGGAVSILAVWIFNIAFRHFSWGKAPIATTEGLV